MTDTNQTAERTTNDTTKADSLSEWVQREDLLIDPEFQKLFSANSTEIGYEGLKEDIRHRGILDKLIGWAEWGILLDGHTRCKIHEELGLETPLPIQWLSFPNQEEARAWMIQHQVFRRNLNTFCNVEAILNLHTFYTTKAKERTQAGKKDLTQTFGEGGEVNKILGRMVKTSGETVRKVKIIKEKALQEDIEALRKDEVSIHSVYEKCQGMDTTKQPTERTKKSPRASVEPSRGLKGKVTSHLQQFAALTNDFPEKTDGIYIYDTLIEWAKEQKKGLSKRKKIKPSKRASEKPTKKVSKKSPKKRVSKKASKKRSKKATK